MQEVRAWLDLDATRDTIPDCVCLVIGRLVIGLNDISEEMRTAIVPYLPRLLGSRGDREVTTRRAFAVADWAVRTIAPDALDAVGLGDHASTLRQLAPITDEKTARVAADATRAAAADAVAAYAYAADAARAAAAYAAAAAAYAAAAYAYAYAADAARVAAVAGAAAYAYVADAAAREPDVVQILSTLLEIS